MREPSSGSSRKSEQILRGLVACGGQLRRRNVSQCLLGARSWIQTLWDAHADVLDIDEGPVPSIANLSHLLPPPSHTLQQVQWNKLELQCSHEVLQLLDVIFCQPLVAQQHPPPCPPQRKKQVVLCHSHYITQVHHHAQQCPHQVHVVAAVSLILFLSPIVVHWPPVNKSIQRGHRSLRVCASQKVFLM